MSDINIPREAVEAARTAFRLMVAKMLDHDTRATGLTDDEIDELNLAAIAAAIEAWPLKSVDNPGGGARVIRNGYITPAIILPLETKP